MRWPSTSTLLPSRIFAQPWITLTPCFFSRAATPLVNRSTIASFQATLWPMSRLGAETLMPRFDCWLCCRVWWNCSATWISALEGMQPMFRQVPPRAWPSTRTVGMPSWPARMAAT
ncbi:hypothetical protein D3C84_1020990 [compost metagenome]